MTNDESRLRLADYLSMRGMRNRMAHGYFDIDLNIVWDTVKSSLPELERQLLPLVSQPTS